MKNGSDPRRGDSQYGGCHIRRYTKVPCYQRYSWSDKEHAASPVSDDIRWVNGVEGVINRKSCHMLRSTSKSTILTYGTYRKLVAISALFLPGVSGSSVVMKDFFSWSGHPLNFTATPILLFFTLSSNEVDEEGCLGGHALPGGMSRAATGCEGQPFRALLCALMQSSIGNTDPGDT